MNPTNNSNDPFTSPPRVVRETRPRNRNRSPSPSVESRSRSPYPTPSTTNITHNGVNINITDAPQPTSASSSSTSAASRLLVQPAQHRRSFSNFCVLLNLEPVSRTSSRITITVTSRPTNSPPQQQTEQTNRSNRSTSVGQSPTQQQQNEQPSELINSPSSLRLPLESPVIENREEQNATSVPSLNPIGNGQELDDDSSAVAHVPTPSTSRMATSAASNSANTANQPQKRKLSESLTPLPEGFGKLPCGSGCDLELSASHLDQDDEMKCPFCEETFTERTNLRDHMSTSHQGMQLEEDDDDENVEK